VQLGVNATPTVLQHVSSGKLLALAVASPKRDRALPNVPTMAEAGVPNLEFLIWYGLFAPAKTPKDIIEKISADMQKAMADPGIAETLRSQGADPEASSPQKFAKLLEEDVRIWGRLIREKKLTLDE
jgi:tripartite-type tricarboxylate transporter receptor subunit TctC